VPTQGVGTRWNVISARFTRTYDHTTTLRPFSGMRKRKESEDFFVLIEDFFVLIVETDAIL
jgi:hypothetical protein